MKDEVMRKCVKCTEEKPLSEFSLEPIIESGYKVKCKTIEIKDAKMWEKHTKEKKESKKKKETLLVW